MSTFKVYGTVFSVGHLYEPIRPLGKGAYGVVWCVAAAARACGRFIGRRAPWVAPPPPSVPPLSLLHWVFKPARAMLRPVRWAWRELAVAMRVVHPAKPTWRICHPTRAPRLAR